MVVSLRPEEAVDGSSCTHMKTGGAWKKQGYKIDTTNWSFDSRIDLISLRASKMQRGKADELTEYKEK